MATRKQYYALIHLGAANLGHKEDPDYRAWLESLTGKRSCVELGERELDGLVTMLRACNALENPRLKSVKGGVGRNRPTSAQWNLANILCRELGMSGCDDVRFAAFAKRNADVDHPRFLTKEVMRVLIQGLIQWHKNVKAKAEKK